MSDDEEQQIYPVGHSSLVELQAELLRKTDSFTTSKGKVEQTLLGGGTGTFGKIAGMTRKKKKKKSLLKKEEDEPPKLKEDPELTLAYERSKQKMLQKEKLYNVLVSGEMEDYEDKQGDTKFLVDFAQKLSKGARTEGIDTSVKSDGPSVASAANKMFYKDKFGRDREKITLPPPLNDVNEHSEDEKSSSKAPTCYQAADDAYREMLKAKWEKEQEEMLADQPIHYENIKYDEIRDLGVGYYAFSKNEEERVKEMEMLKNLRKQTVNQQEKQDALKRKRQQVLQARLDKVKKRKGLPTDSNTNTTDIDNVSQSKVVRIDKLSEVDIISEAGQVSSVHDSTSSFRTDASTSSFRSKNLQPLNISSSSPSCSILQSEGNVFGATKDETSHNPEFAPPSNYFTETSQLNKRKFHLDNYKT